MALEKIFATQIVTWQPPLPQRAFQITAAGTTTDNMGSGGTSTDGKRYGYFVLNTSTWAVEEGFHTPPIAPGEKFQLCTSYTSIVPFLNPPAFDNGTIKQNTGDSNSSGGAPDLFAISALMGPGRPSSSYAADVTAAAASMATAVSDNATAITAYNAGPGTTWGPYHDSVSTCIADFAACVTKANAANANAYNIAAASPFAQQGLSTWNAAASAFTTAAAAAIAAFGWAGQAGATAAATAFSNAAAQCQNAAGQALNAAANANVTTSRDGVPTGYAPLWTIKDPTVCTVQSVQQAGSGAWYVYYSPNLANFDTINTNTDGIITVPMPSNPRYLGQYGHVGSINYTWSIPGGPDQLTCTLLIEPTFRTDALNPGRIVTAHRGGSCIWEGQLVEPTYTPTGITLTANGIGTCGTNFGAWWDLNLLKGAGWTADAPIDLAISRGLRWVNRGIGTPTGLYLGPVQDPGSLSVTDFLNLLCTGGALTWELVQPAGAASWPPAPWELKVYQMPMDFSGNPLALGPASKVQTKQLTDYKRPYWKRVDSTTTRPRTPPDLFLINTSPISRTLVNDVNTVIVYYQVAPDKKATSTKTAAAAVYNTTFADVPGSVAAHGRMEYYLDISNGGPYTKAQAQAIGQNVLTKYVRANFAAAFSVQPGQLVNTGGVPVDLGLNWVGATCTVQVVNEAFGGEVAMAPISFLIGQYQFDDETQTAQVTPYQNALTDIDSVVAALYPGKFS